jgi:integrase/recombinase XerD
MLNNPEARSPIANAKSLKLAIRQTAALWRRHHVSYDDTRAIARAARAQLEIARPRVRRTVVDRLSQDEARRLITHAYRAGGQHGLMVKTLLLSGCRISEFVALAVGDFFLDETMLMIRRGKGDKGRGVPILASLAQELHTHLAGRRAGFIFETRSSKAFSPRRVQQIIKAVAAAAGIEKRVYPHLLRHSAAQALLDNGMPLEHVQRFLGHERIGTTEIYAASTPAAIRASYHNAMSRAS